MIVYHGSTVIVRRPDTLHSYRALDFGKGFYVTTVRDQAVRWALRRADLFGGKAIVNQYEMELDLSGLQTKCFPDDLEEWIEFVCDCRDGSAIYEQFDLIIGKVADDKVFRVVDLFQSGLWDKERALKEIRVYPNYDQIAFITQKAIDRLLRYSCSWEV